MHTLGSAFIPPPFHAGGLRYHGMAPLVSHLQELGLIESRAYHQTECFAAGVQFAQAEGIVPAPEANHAIKAVVDEALICKEAGAYVPWLRPAELATDTASPVDAALHTLDWYEAEKGNVDGILLLQPTSPFRTRATVQQGIELFGKHGHQPVLGVSPTHAHPMWTLKMEGDYLVPFVQEHSAYVVNGSFYLISPTELRACRSFVGPKTIPLLIESPQEAIDIDTEWDFKMAEFIVANFCEN